MTRCNLTSTQNSQPKSDDAALAVACRTAQWMLDDAAANLQADRITPAKGREIAHVLEGLVAMIRDRTNAVIDGTSE